MRLAELSRGLRRHGMLLALVILLLWQDYWLFRLAAFIDASRLGPPSAEVGAPQRRAVVPTPRQLLAHYHLLQGHPGVAPTPRQRQRLEALERRSAAVERRMNRAVAKLRAILTAAQRDRILELRLRNQLIRPELGPPAYSIRGGPVDVSGEVERVLQDRAAPSSSPSPALAPVAPSPPAGPPETLSLNDYLWGILNLERTEDLALDGDQAWAVLRLLPEIRALVREGADIHREVLALLSREQLTFLAQRLGGRWP